MHVHHVQMFDLAVGGDDGEEARVEGMPAETYMERFSWDEAKYPPRRPLKDTVSAVTDIVAELEDSLKARIVPPTWAASQQQVSVIDDFSYAQKHFGGRIVPAVKMYRL